MWCHVWALEPWFVVVQHALSHWQSSRLSHKTFVGVPGGRIPLCHLCDCPQSFSLPEEGLQAGEGQAELWKLQWPWELKQALALCTLPPPDPDFPPLLQLFCHCSWCTASHSIAVLGLSSTQIPCWPWASCSHHPCKPELGISTHIIPCHLFPLWCKQADKGISVSLNCTTPINTTSLTTSVPVCLTFSWEGGFFFSPAGWYLDELQPLPGMIITRLQCSLARMWLLQTPSN